MRVYVNQKPMDMVLGMQVRHALVRAEPEAAIAAGLKVYDEIHDRLVQGYPHGLQRH